MAVGRGLPENCKQLQATFYLPQATFELRQATTNKVLTTTRQNIVFRLSGRGTVSEANGC